MAAAAFLIIAVFVVAAIAIGAVQIHTALVQFRGRRLVSCPETAEPVYVSLDPAAAAVPATLGWPPDFRLRTCTRWPDRRWCGQSCLLEIARAPETTLMREIESVWYSGKRCVRCGEALSGIASENEAPPILSPTHTRVEWKEIAPDRLNDVLATYSPLCVVCARKT